MTYEKVILTRKKNTIKILAKLYESATSHSTRETINLKDHRIRLPKFCQQQLRFHMAIICSSGAILQTQLANDVAMSSYVSQCNVMTSHRRQNGVVRRHVPVVGLTYRKLIAILGVVIPFLRRWNDLLEVFIQGRSFDCTYMAALYCRFTITGTKVTVCAINYGCAITNIFAPDKNGVTDDIVLGYDNVAGKHLGKTLCQSSAGRESRKNVKLPSIRRSDNTSTLVRRQLDVMASLKSLIFLSLVGIPR